VTPDRRTRLWLFLYSNGNIAGCLLGLAGVGLYLFGVIDRWWLPITAGLYAAGYFAAPAADPLRLRTEITEEMLRQALDELIGSVRKRVPAEALRLLESIRATLDGVLPKLAELKSARRIDDPHAFTIGETVTRYLPDALDSYVRLPPAYAAAHHLPNGKTPRQALIEQLGLLDAKLKEVADDLFRGDAEALALNGRFLEEKFRGTQFPG
jgi:hypothetical protein